jgi:hypothetical protein
MLTAPLMIMRQSLLSLLALGSLLGQTFAVEYTAVPSWFKMPADRGLIGSMHGDVAVASNGEVYVSVMDPKLGVQVFADDGKYLRNVPDAPADFHGFVIHKDADGEFIYGTGLTSGDIVKMGLDGKVAMKIPSSAIPDEFKSKSKDGKPVVRLTAMDVAPNGELFITDGYSSDYVHRFDKTGKYLKSFGGKKEPYNFKTLHKIAVDTRFTPPRIIGCDRANGRVVHMSLDGEFIGVIAEKLRKPAAVAVQGEYAVIGELGGPDDPADKTGQALAQVTVLDKAGKVAAVFGTNKEPKDEPATNKCPPDLWRTGFVTAPHGVAFSAKGDIFVAEYNLYGRIHRFNRK